MHFFGQEEAVSASPTEVERPIRGYTFKTWGGKWLTVEAQYIKFEAGHVTFWLDRPEPNFQDTLVLAEANSNVNELKEVQR